MAEDMTATMTKYPLNEAGLEALSGTGAEWLKTRRSNGKARLEQTRFPERTDETWRRTSPKLFKLEGKHSVAGKSDYGVIGEGKAPDGITFGAIEDLLTEKLIDASVPEHASAHNYFSALNETYWRGGTLLKVGQDISLGDLALHSKHHYSGHDADSIALPRSVVEVGKFSKVTLVETFSSDQNPLMAAPLVDIKVAEGCTVKYVIVQAWGAETTIVPTVRASVAKDAHLQVLYVGLGGKITKMFGESDLEGEGCKSEVNGLVMAANKQHFDFDVNQYHRVGNNVSDVLFHIALADEARSIFSGNVLCEPGSQKIDGYQQNRNLLLSDKARADSMPKLEIEANDVACTHGATFTTYDADQNFYCRSRGLDEAEAQRLLVRGFFQEVVNRVEDQVVVEHLMDLVAEKMDLVLGA